MLAEGADPLVAADKGATPVHLASMGGESAMVQDLIDAALARQRPEGDARALLSARVGAGEGEMLAHIAAMTGEVCTLRLVDMLWPGGEPFVATDNLGLMPLHLAAMKSTEALAFLVGVTPRDAIDTQAPDVVTALHLAAHEGNTIRVLLLLGAGADPNAEPPMGRFPLTLMSLKDKLQAVCALLSHGARVDARSVDGFTALHLAALNDNRPSCTRCCGPAPTRRRAPPRRPPRTTPGTPPTRNAGARPRSSPRCAATRGWCA